MLLHTSRDVWLVVFGASIGCLMALLATSSPGELSCSASQLHMASHSGLPGIGYRENFGDLVQGLDFKTGAELGVQVPLNPILKNTSNQSAPAVVAEVLASLCPGRPPRHVLPPGACRQEGLPKTC
jgi:hypothetical protein